MRHFFSLLILATLVSGCQRHPKEQARSHAGNAVAFAKGFSLFPAEGFTLLRVTDPWPGADKTFDYVLLKKGGHVPDSLKEVTVIPVPVRRLIATSTTHLPSLEMLDAENALVGFPNMRYISSPVFTSRAKSGFIKELGSNQDLNTEVALSLQPDVVIGYGIDNDNRPLENLQRAGLKVVFNGDWNEATPLGKAEWIKFFGALLGKEKAADSIFTDIENRYGSLAVSAKAVGRKPKVLVGGMFQDQWNVPKGDSWNALMIADAGGNYPWQNERGTGSLALSLETVLQQAADADIWISPGTYQSLEELASANPHYREFSAFRNKQVYGLKQGETGGILYYELAPNRPDLVLADLLAMFHPGRYPGHAFTFFKKLP